MAAKATAYEDDAQYEITLAGRIKVGTQTIRPIADRIEIKGSALNSLSAEDAAKVLTANKVG